MDITPDSGLEEMRLSELERYKILDTLPEQVYDDIVRLAATICGAPIALMSLVDEHRQWFKAKIGLDATETPRDQAFCAHAIAYDEPLVIRDTQLDTRFADNPLVVGAPGIRFYAGAPLRTANGAALGTLCVIDRIARDLSPTQLAALEALARQVMTHLELRAKHDDFARLNRAMHAETQALEATKERLRLTVEATQVGIWDWDIANRKVWFSDRWKALLGYAPDEISDDESEWATRIHPDDKDGVIAWTSAGVAQANTPFSLDYRMQHKTGCYIWLSVQAIAEHDGNGIAVRALGSALDITEQRGAEDAVRTSNSRLQRILDQVAALTGILTPDGLLLEINQAASRFATVSVEDLLNKPFDEAYWFSHSQIVQSQIREAMRAARARIPVRFDCEVKVASDKFRTLDLSISPVLGEDEEVEFLIASAIDITERKIAQDGLYQEKERAQITLHSIGDAVITTNALGIIDQMNPVAESLTGFLHNSAVGLHINDVFKIYNETTRLPVENPLEVALREGVIVGLANHTVLVRPDKSEISIDDSAGPIRAASGEIIGAVLIFRDVSEERRLHRHVSRQASHDSLTDLPNRREFERRLELMLESAHTHATEHALCYLDLDQFKIINDTCGHAAGDALLTQLSGLLKTKVRQRDTLARLGGDEFGLILGECPLDRAMDIATSLKESIGEFRFNWEQHVFSVGVSIGLTPITARSGDVQTLLSAADSACYAAKEKGRNQIQVYETDDTEFAAVRGEMQWVNRLQSAIANDRFRLYFQEITALTDAASKPPRREVLLRLVEADASVLPPGAFMPSAERYGEIDKIDRLVFDKVCDILNATESSDPFVCNVNLSGRSIGSEDFLCYVINAIDAKRVNGARVCFEITETAAISNLHAAQNFMATLKLKGCEFALDDFGSGLSSFNYLKNLAVDSIKIDGSFVRDMVSDPIDHAMVEAIHRVARIMGVATVAEHVEDEQTIAALRALGIDYAQGYALSLPQPFPEYG